MMPTQLDMLTMVRMRLDDRLAHAVTDTERARIIDRILSLDAQIQRIRHALCNGPVQEVDIKLYLGGRNDHDHT